MYPLTASTRPGIVSELNLPAIYNSIWSVCSIVYIVSELNLPAIYN